MRLRNASGKQQLHRYSPPPLFPPKRTDDPDLAPPVSLRIKRRSNPSSR
jgi:hypothetical protein